MKDTVRQQAVRGGQPSHPISSLLPWNRKTCSSGLVASGQKNFTLFTLCLVVDAGETDGLSIIVLYLFLVFFDLRFILKSFITLVSDNNWVRNIGVGNVIPILRARKLRLTTGSRN